MNPFVWMLEVAKVTTAENGKRALEYLGLADGQHPNHGVSNHTMKV
ncbi:hypothetical protein NC651_040053 [Populus alba x Populus x berolinensis]|nr:hypothetical protein NC651_040053 [Populus alba x Populus x berolinensis]